MGEAAMPRRAQEPGRRDGRDSSPPRSFGWLLLDGSWLPPNKSVMLSTVSFYASGPELIATFSFDPLLTGLGPFQLGLHGMFTALAIVVAVWLTTRLAERQGLPVEKIENVALWGIFGGVIGARLFHVLDHLSYFAEHPAEIVQVWNGGIAVYGGFIGGVAAGWIEARRMRLPKWRLLDIAAPAMLVGQAIGRLGCLSNGDAWGAACNGAPGLCIAYVNPNDLLPDDLRGVPTHAYPIYEIVCEAIILYLLWRFADRLLKRPGQLFLAAALGYALVRFVLTYFRQETIIVAGLQEAQVVALATAVVVAAAYALFGPSSAMLRTRPTG